MYLCLCMSCMCVWSCWNDRCVEQDERETGGSKQWDMHVGGLSADWSQNCQDRRRWYRKIPSLRTLPLGPRSAINLHLSAKLNDHRANEMMSSPSGAGSSADLWKINLTQEHIWTDPCSFCFCVLMLHFEISAIWQMRTRKGWTYMQQSTYKRLKAIPPNS